MTAPDQAAPAPGVPPEVRDTLAALRAEFEARSRDASHMEWARLSVETRCVLLLSAGIESDADLLDLAGKAWRELTPPERDAIKTAGRMLRLELIGARRLFW